MSTSKPGLYDPIISPPPGEHANLKDPYSLRAYDALTQTLCLAITSILILIRLYTKARVLRSVGWDDWTSLAAWNGLIVYGVILFEGDRYGSGRTHVERHGGELHLLCRLGQCLADLLSDRHPAEQDFYLAAVPARLCAGEGDVDGVTWGFCRPREKIWMPWIDGKCLDQFGLQLVSAVFNTISDLVLVVLPIGTVRNLVLERSTKIGLIAIFGTASLACIASSHYRNDVLDAAWDYYPLNLCSYVSLIPHPPNPIHFPTDPKHEQLRRNRLRNNLQLHARPPRLLPPPPNLLDDLPIDDRARIDGLRF
ncbi:MAG: hypothetical protein Q9222_004345 [Ikaeria aurantiellina]